MIAGEARAVIVPDALTPMPPPPTVGSSESDAPLGEGELAASCISLVLVGEFLPVTDEVRLASLFDHVLLRPDARQQDIDRLCDEAQLEGFASVCVNPRWVARVASRLRGSEVLVGTVIGFPFGATFGATKAAETDEAVGRGAQELDMVVDIGALLDRDHRYVLRDIQQVVEAAQGNLVKVTLEMAMLPEAARRRGAELARDGGATFVKTSTGFGPAAVSVADVALLRSVVGSAMGVQASGGIRTLAGAMDLLEAGADRLGSRNALQIIEGQEDPA